MCGITGILSLKGQAIDTIKLQRMTDVIIHRGPDGQGIWANSSSKIGFGHRRLSIIDLSDKGKQPMHYRDRYTITFNGEIYNYIEIKHELLKSGYTFYSETDTEVILAGYDYYGPEVVNQLDGMFSFAIWDEQEQVLFCARDRFGEKPFYYTTSNTDYFIFGSEIKCLFTHGADKTVNEQVLFYYLAYDLLENPEQKKETFYKNIYKLEASHYLLIDKSGTIHKHKYWHLGIPTHKNTISLTDAVEQFKELLTQSVKLRLRSDVAIGSSLSGGIDSSSIVALINQLNTSASDQKTFSARFNSNALDEGKFIDCLKNKYALNSYNTYPNENDLMNNYEKIFYHQEEPFGSGSVFAQWEVMKLASQQNTTVLLDGQGADEVLSGYHKYFMPFLRELYNEDIREYRRLKHLINSTYSKHISMNALFWLESQMPEFLKTLRSIKRKYINSTKKIGLNPDFIEPYTHLKPPFPLFNTLPKTLLYDTTVYGLEKLLRVADKNSMAFSREVRLPFLNHKLVEFSLSLPSSFIMYEGWTKYILRKSMEPILPKEIAWRKDKIGYQAPSEVWLESEKVRTLVKDSESFLINQKIIQKNNTIPGLKLIDTALLYKFF